MASKAKKLQNPAEKGHLQVAELVSDRAAAPSPFGDDQAFPLPIDRLKHLPQPSAH
ncbi:MULTISPECIES: hypothetical protein [Actinoplanes]|uniref:Uncharacterized protein n=1 Tax=Actinoplanes palleronii TaxID=113570 RepID=A0ABQ4BAL4_9ACTN|nr:MULTISPECIES: hypothetical protein [Actinoplanes]GIE67749.1 hypothetical protein Apa02nite_038570 [Actinoplanes palleronii]